QNLSKQAEPPLTSHFEGVAFLHSDNVVPSVAVGFHTKNKDRTFSCRTDWIHPIDRNSGMITSWETIKDQYPNNVTFSNHADVQGMWNEEEVMLSWTSEIGNTGSCVLPRSKAGTASSLIPLSKDWKEYKTYVSKLEGRRFLFRGQNEPWRLRTSFHRSGRADLMRFIREDVQILHKHLSARTKHVFNLDNANENGAFHNLIQHHGYPTPLLDWTYSPYVAAFFAYRGISNAKARRAGINDKVRILVFNQAQWKKDVSQVYQLISAVLHLSIGEYLAIENERMIPQQAASTLTNIDDIESYIQLWETAGGPYLTAIDLPVYERKNIIQELGYMGITAGAMFPGLDGACEELKERNFDI
ncbi:MAG: hypothetical protein A4E20_17525, partial [Nitrospira sp. SG-bin2]